MNSGALTRLDSSYHNALNLAKKIPDHKWYQQFHPDLSPIGWHIGHCVFIESYWLQNKLAGKKQAGNDLKNLYMPWLSPREERGKKLPAPGELIKTLTNQHQQNLDLLDNYIQKGSDHKLLENNYLPAFLTQHYCQHIETLHQIIQCIKLAHNETGHVCTKPLEPGTPTLPEKLFQGGNTWIGATGKIFAYDNELTRHEESLDSFMIATGSVTNSQYLGFMESGGYENKNFWSKEGQQWLVNNNTSSPIHWKIDSNKNHYCIEFGIAKNISPDEPVYGINYFEAEAFANYAGCRLPTEVEWEHAATIEEKSKLKSGQAWEWCENYFYPYQGFIAHPYKNYSSPWFDNQHHTLRGGSLYTDPELKRPTFRNFFTPEKKHIFAGARLARNA